MRKLMVAMLLVSASMGAANADDFRGLYWGLDVGQSTLDVEKSDLDHSTIAVFEAAGATVLDGQSSLSRYDATYGVTIGYQLFRFLAFEAAYMDLGNARYTADGTLGVGAAVADGHLKIESESKGFALSGLGMLPLGNWNLFARLGGYYSMVDTSLSARVGSASAWDSQEDNSVEFLWGAGVGYTAGAWTTRVEYQTITEVGDADVIGEADVQKFLLGVTYRFGE